jgi:DNA-binding GntR family transcriptional regulator
LGADGSGEVELRVDAPIAAAPLYRQQVYHQLRGAILSGELPRGSRLSPAKLAARFGVSTMPIREALRLLEEDGLVEMSARRWTRVASPDWALAGEVYPIVGLLEEHAIATGPFMSADQLARLEAANEELRAAVEAGNVQACVDADRRFHDIFAEGNANATLQRTISSLKARLALLESAFFQTAHSSRVSVRQHAEALDAARAGDLAQAGAHIRANWEHGLEVVRRAAGSEAAASAAARS